MKKFALPIFAAAIALAPLPLTAKSATHSSAHSATKSHSTSAEKFTAKVKFIEVDEDHAAPHDLDELNQIKGAYLLSAPSAGARAGRAAETKVTTPFRAASHFDDFDFPSAELGVAFQIAAKRGDDQTQYAVHTTDRNLSRSSKSESGAAMNEVTSRDYYSTGSVANGHALWLDYKNPFLHKKLVVYIKFAWTENGDEAPAHKHSTRKKKSPHS